MGNSQSELSQDCQKFRKTLCYFMVASSALRTIFTRTSLSHSTCQIRYFPLVIYGNVYLTWSLCDLTTEIVQTIPSRLFLKPQVHTYVYAHKRVMENLIFRMGTTQQISTNIWTMLYSTHNRPFKWRKILMIFQSNFVLFKFKDRKKR